MYERYWYFSKFRSHAIDQACLDLVYGSNDPGKEQLIQRIESLHEFIQLKQPMNLDLEQEHMN